MSCKAGIPRFFQNVIKSVYINPTNSLWFLCVPCISRKLLSVAWWEFLTMRLDFHYQLQGGESPLFKKVRRVFLYEPTIWIGKLQRNRTDPELEMTGQPRCKYVELPTTRKNFKTGMNCVSGRHNWRTERECSIRDVLTKKTDWPEGCWRSHKWTVLQLHNSLRTRTAKVAKALEGTKNETRTRDAAQGGRELYWDTKSACWTRLIKQGLRRGVNPLGNTWKWEMCAE